MRTSTTLLLLACILLGACQPISPTVGSPQPSIAPTSIMVEEPSPAPSPVPTEPAEPISTASTNESPSPALDLSEMITIEAGSFWIGCDPEAEIGFGCLPQELPLQQVDLPAFAIDKYEVTNGQYGECVEAGACSLPTSRSSATRENYFENPEFTDYPVIYISWKQAAAYCTWAGKRLPTEAEWEKAARGTEKNSFPWGNEASDCEKSNAMQPGSLAYCEEDTQRVGTYPQGASDYGVMDMAGNVWEWTASRYLPDYRPTAEEPPLTGGVSDFYRVVRGGGWGSAPVKLVVSARAFDPDFHNSDNLGFRCAMDSSANP